MKIMAEKLRPMCANGFILNVEMFLSISSVKSGDIIKLSISILDNLKCRTLQW